MDKDQLSKGRANGAGSQGVNQEERGDATAVKVPEQKRYKLITCEIIFREICGVIAESPHLIDVEFMRKGLHDAGKEKMCAALQDVVSSVKNDDYDAILLGYGRCNDGVVGLEAGSIPLVIPRAHDCITFFFGSREAYQAYFDQYPGTYYRTTGWTERGSAGDDSVMAQLGLNQSYQEYVEKYGADNARYIMESLGGWTEQYHYITYIDMGLGVDERYARLAEQEAAEKQLQFRRLRGDGRLLEMLVNGPWPDDEFLVVEPGCRIVANDDGMVLTAVSSDNREG